MTSMILLGPPGVGKGTQAALIAERLNIPAISTGNIFRQNISEGTELGRLAQYYIDQGDFVPDSVTNTMVEERLTAPDTANGFLLDGYPRTLGQAYALRDILAKYGKQLDVVVEIVAPDDVLTQRMLHRAYEENRADDKPEIFKHRVEVYHQQTEPIATYYADHDLLVQADGTGSIEQVTEQIMAALQSHGIDINSGVQ